MDKKKCANVFVGYSEIKSKNAIHWEKNQSEKYREYRRRWVEYPKKLIVPDFPLHLDIEVTSNCNLRCPMCARTVAIRKGIWRPNRDMNFELFKKIIDEGSEKGLYAVNLNNFGEPLLHPKIADMVKYAKDKGIIDVFFHTNGVILTKELGKKLIEAKLDTLIISFDSPYKEKYEKIRIGAKYEKVLKNIKDFAELKKEMKSQIPITRINKINFTDTTRKGLEDMKKLFTGLVDVLGFRRYSEADIEKREIPNFPEGYKSKFICPRPIIRLTILEDGTVLPCCEGSAQIRLGNATNSPLEEIWKSEKLKNLRKLHFEGKYFKIPACKTCDFAIQGDKLSNNGA